MRRLASILLVTITAFPLHASQARAEYVPRSSSPLVTVGHIEIPGIKVKHTIYKGVTDRQFDRGVGFWPGTASPGAKGNVVIGGHRTSNPRPFYSIEKLKKGDVIKISRPGKTFTYRVSQVFVVRPTAMWIVKQTPQAVLTLFTCHPRGSTSKRYVVRATLVTR